MNRGAALTLTSFRGGVGRTMAVANLAWLLANSGKRVLAVDWNLSAPRLGELFSPFCPDFDPRTRAGVIDILWEYVLEHYRVGSTYDSDVARQALVGKVIELSWSFQRGGTLHFLNAGLAESYRVRHRLFPWSDFYSQLGGSLFAESTRESLLAMYDYVVIDGPTVLQDTSALTTLGIADAAAFCCLAAGNDIEATALAAARIAGARGARPSHLPVDRALRIFPVLMRAEYGELSLLDETRARMHTVFRDLHSSHSESTQTSCEVPHVPYYSYGNPLAAAWSGPSDRLAAAYRGILSAAFAEEPPPFLPPSREELAWLEAHSKSQAAPLPFELLCESAARRELRPCTAARNHFFVSYRRQHFNRIVVTLDQIQKMGFDVWWDEGIQEGAAWKAELTQRIESCRAVLLFFDHTGTESSAWVQWELQTARRSGKQIVPIQLDNVDPGPELDEDIRQLQFLKDPGAKPSAELEATLRRLSL